MTNRRKGDLTEKAETIESPVKKRNGGFIPILIPTESHRHMTGIRAGKVSAEIFCKNPERRRELGLPVLRSEI